MSPPACHRTNWERGLARHLRSHATFAYSSPRFLFYVGTRKHTVISVGTLPEVLSLREALLESVGYEVFTERPQEAASRIRNGNCGVLLLCYSVREEWWAQLIREFSERCPEGRIVVISNGKVGELPKEVDALVYGIEGAEALINAVRGDGNIPVAA